MIPESEHSLDAAGLLFPVLMIVVFYFLLIRPQQRRMREHRALVSTLSLEDDVITAGGIFGRIVRLGEEAVEVELVDGARMKVLRSAISRKIVPEVADDSVDDTEES